MPSRWKIALLINENYYCFGIMVTKLKKDKKIRRNKKKQEKCVVECCTDTLELLCVCFYFVFLKIFLKRAQTRGMVPPTPPDQRGRE